MKILTIRKAREGLGHPEQMFTGGDEVLVVCRGEYNRPPYRREWKLSIPASHSGIH
jgi:hypothetical protein